MELAVLRIEEGRGQVRRKARLETVLDLFEDHLGDGGKLLLPRLGYRQPLDFDEFGLRAGDVRQFDRDALAVGGEEAGVEAARTPGRRDRARNKDERADVGLHARFLKRLPGRRGRVERLCVAAADEEAGFLAGLANGG